MNLIAGQLNWLERGTHKPEVSGSITLPATKNSDLFKVATFFPKLASMRRQMKVRILKIFEKWYTEERKIMKKLSKKNKIRQIKMLNKNLQKIKRRKNKRVKDEKKQLSENVRCQKIARYRIII